LLDMSDVKKYAEIGARLTLIREALRPGMKKTDYADLIRVKYTTYLNWESGLNRPQPDQAEVMCDKLGLTMDFIYRGIEAALPQNTLNALSSKSRDRAHNTSNENPDSSAH